MYFLIGLKGKDYGLFNNKEHYGGVCSSSLVESFNIKSETIVLPTAADMTVENGTFGDWYDNASFSGNPVTEITQGRHGNIELYALWVMEAPTILDLTAADSTVLGQVTPTIIVNLLVQAGKYIVNAVEYSTGSIAFATIAEAIKAAKENDVIYVFAGTYDEELTVTTANLSIIGPNYNINGTVTRNGEANVTDLTAINAQYVIINGLKFTGNGAIKVGAANVTITITITNVYMSVLSIKMYSNNRKGCIVNGVDNLTDYLSNLVISN